MFHKIVLFFFTPFIILSACANSNSGPIKPFEPTEQQKITYQTALQFVASYHFAKPTIDDSFSVKAFSNYIENIDPSRVYFLQEDIDRFQQYKLTLDEGIISGDLNAAFDIFNTYQTRQYERIQFAKSLLTTAVTFTEVDSFEIDRENMPYCKNFASYDKLWQQKIKYELMIAKAGKDDTAFKYIDDVKKRYENLEKFSLKTKGDDIFQLYINSLLEITDPHTNFFSPRTAEDFNQSMSLSLEGIGAQLQIDNEYTKIREIIKGGPADKSKQLFAGDKIIGVAQSKDSDVVNVVDWRIDDVVSLIRGKKGTPVRLKIIPAIEPNSTKFVDLIRDKIILEEQSAKSSIKLITQNGKKVKMGIITIPIFYIDFAAAGRGETNYKSTTRDVKRLIDSLKLQKIDALIIDLRNNGGGSLQEAIELTGLFIKDGPIVQVKYADGNMRVETDRDAKVYFNGPLAVLVNRFSASASEIFAAAIQDYDRGVIVGERTFGKGTVQNMVDLNEFIQYNDKKLGQVKLTIAKFYRVNGGSTQHKGVTPDIELPGVFDADKFGEDASPYALPWDQINPATINNTNIMTGAREYLKKNHKIRIQKSSEYAYLLQDIKSINEQRNTKYVTLVESKYKAELNKNKEQNKAREEMRKKERKNNNDTPDLILEESEQVMLDLITVNMGKK